MTTRAGSSEVAASRRSRVVDNLQESLLVFRCWQRPREMVQMTFDEYLSQSCDDVKCNRVATHNASGSKWCNIHLPSDVRAFARND